MYILLGIKIQSLYILTVLRFHLNLWILHMINIFICYSYTSDCVTILYRCIVVEHQRVYL